VEQRVRAGRRQFAAADPETVRTGSGPVLLKEGAQLLLVLVPRKIGGLFVAGVQGLGGPLHRHEGQAD